MVSAAFTLTVITVFGGLVYFGLERKLARAPPTAPWRRIHRESVPRERTLTAIPALNRRCS